MKVVRVIAVGSDAQPREAARLELRDGEIGVVGESLGQGILDRPIYGEDGELVQASDDPEAFLQRLHLNYSGSRLRCTEVEEVDDAH